MKKEFNHEKIKEAIRTILTELGDNPDREGLKDTPDRVARMYDEIFEGMRYTNDEIAEMFNKCFEVDSNDLVIVKDIEVFSHCEHHLALMYNMHCHGIYSERQGYRSFKDCPHMRYGFKKTSASRTYLLGYCRSYSKGLRY